MISLKSIVFSNSFSMARMASAAKRSWPIVFLKWFFKSFSFENDLSPLQFVTNIHKYILNIIVTFGNASSNSISIICRNMSISNNFEGGIKFASLIKGFIDAKWTISSSSSFSRSSGYAFTSFLADSSSLCVLKLVMFCRKPKLLFKVLYASMRPRSEVVSWSIIGKYTFFWKKSLAISTGESVSLFEEHHSEKKFVLRLCQLDSIR